MSIGPIVKSHSNIVSLLSAAREHISQQDVRCIYMLAARIHFSRDGSRLDSVVGWADCNSSAEWEQRGNNEGGDGGERHD
jgi:hypothetical protein